MKQPAHTITLEPWSGTSFGVKVAIQSMALLLLPLKEDDRMSALINVLGHEILNVAETDDQIDAIVEVLRMQLKMILAADSPPLQGD